MKNQLYNLVSYWACTPVGWFNLGDTPTKFHLGKRALSNKNITIKSSEKRTAYFIDRRWLNTTRENMKL